MKEKDTKYEVCGMDNDIKSIRKVLVPIVEKKNENISKRDIKK